VVQFEPSDKKQILDRIKNQMPNDGSLFLGGAETVLGVSDKFQPIPDLRGVYTPA